MNDENQNPFAKPARDVPDGNLALPPEASDAAPPSTGYQIDLRSDSFVVVALLILNMLGAALITPFAMLFVSADPKLAQIMPFWVLLIVNVATYAVFAAVMIPIGVWLAPRVGLDAPVLRGIARGDFSLMNPFRSGWIGALIFAVVSGSALYTVSQMLPKDTLGAEVNDEAVRQIVSAPAWIPTLASIGAGLTEETQFRFGFMGLFVWIGCLITNKWRPGAANLWISNILASLPFSAAHIGNLLVLGGEITPASLAFIFLGNGTIALGFGWLYSKYGIESAMASHVLADIVLKVLWPLIWPMQI